MIQSESDLFPSTSLPCFDGFFYQTIRCKYNFELFIFSADGPGDVNTTIANFSASTINIGDSTTMYCYADSNPSPSYELLKDGVVLATHGATDQTVSFSIGPVQLNDDGEYTCKATNQHGFDEVTVNLTVSRKYIHMSIERNYTVMTGKIFRVQNYL